MGAVEPSDSNLPEPHARGAVGFAVACARAASGVCGQRAARRCAPPVPLERRPIIRPSRRRRAIDRSPTVAAVVISVRGLVARGARTRQEAALRRVATLVAQGAPSQAVFDAVCEETARLMSATTVNLAHFTPDGFNETVAGCSARGVHVPAVTRLPLEGDTINS